MQDFSQQLISALQEYSETCEDEIQKILQDVGKEAQAKLSKTSPKRTGKYKRGWKVDITRKAGECTVSVHNTRYQLTHLLENGHRTRNGGFVSAQVHIAPVDTWAKEEAEKRIKEVFSK